MTQMIERSVQAVTYLLIVIAAFFTLPVFVYLVVRLATTAYYRGLRASGQQSQEGDSDNDEA